MAQFAVRPASVGDARATAELFAAVAGERDAIATEPPVDVEKRTALFACTAAGTVVAVATAGSSGCSTSMSAGTASASSARKQYRRDSGELWDSIVMGLQL